MADYTSKWTSTEIDEGIQRAFDAAGPGETISVTLPVSGWSGNKQTAENSLFLANGYSYVVSPAYASYWDYADSYILAQDVITDGQMFFTCEVTPEKDVTVLILRTEVN